jgi:hypothetical protein
MRVLTIKPFERRSHRRFPGASNLAGACDRGASDIEVPLPWHRYAILF